VSPIGDGTEPRTLHAEGYPGASSFGPEKSHQRGNYARAGARDIRRAARGVAPPSDVTDRAECIANLGRAAAAGVVSGARLGRPGA